mmetsp:Transcript_2094/g.6029  ORF Transcript_2094/g.6029 Transcript_2094/m.6029 type:complete len:398 (+) Transcript_2094:167-1360(+)
MTNQNASWDVPAGPPSRPPPMLARTTLTQAPPPLSPNGPTLRRNSLSFNAVSTFYKAGSAVAQSAGISLEKMTMGRAGRVDPYQSQDQHQYRRPSSGKFDLARPPANPSQSPNTGAAGAPAPSRPKAQKRISIGFGVPKHVETHRETIGQAFPTRQEVKSGNVHKVHGKADFSISPSIRQKAQHRNTIAHQTLAARAATKSTRNLNPSCLREDMEAPSLPSGEDEGASPSLKPSTSAPDCAEFANQSIRRNSRDYRSHVEYYRPKLQLNRCSAIKQGCSTQEDIHHMTATVTQAAYNKRLSSCSNGSASPRPNWSTPPSSTLDYIMMMNQSGLGEIADLYKRIESGADINPAVLTDDGSSSSSSSSDRTTYTDIGVNSDAPKVTNVFEKMRRRSYLQ